MLGIGQQVKKLEILPIPGAQAAVGTQVKEPVRIPANGGDRGTGWGGASTDRQLDHILANVRQEGCPAGMPDPQAIAGDQETESDSIPGQGHLTPRGRGLVGLEILQVALARHPDPSIRGVGNGMDGVIERLVFGQQVEPLAIHQQVDAFFGDPTSRPPLVRRVQMRTG